MLLKFMTMNTDDENRDEIEAQEAARLTVKLDGDVIMGEIMKESSKSQVLKSNGNTKRIIETKTAVQQTNKI